MSVLADDWHDPSGPVRESISPTAQDGVDFVVGGYINALNELFREAARAAGMDDALIEEIIAQSSQG